MAPWGIDEMPDRTPPGRLLEKKCAVLVPLLNVLCKTAGLPRLFGIRSCYESVEFNFLRFAIVFDALAISLKLRVELAVISRS